MLPTRSPSIDIESDIASIQELARGGSQPGKGLGAALMQNLAASEPVLRQSHPMESSKILLELMALSGKAADSAENEALDGLISVGVLRSLLSALHFRDENTIGHSRRVALLALGMAKNLGWEGRHLRTLEVSALLHDIGKIGVPDNVLFKPGALSPDEAELMSLHHQIGLDVLQACRVDSQVLEIVGQSHSYYNGALDGFHCIGSDFHLGARILAVADAYDSLATDQVYREAKSHREVMQILTQHAGTRFDGNVVSALTHLTQDTGLPLKRSSVAAELDSLVAIIGAAPADEIVDASSICNIFSYLQVLENLYDGFYIVNSDLRFVVWNRGAEKLLGHSTDHMLKRVWTSGELGYADRSGAYQTDDECPMHKVLATGRPTTSTLQVRHANGSWKEVEVQTAPLVDHSHRLVGVAEIFRDLSRNARKPQEYRELRLAASPDALTSVANRGELENQLAALLTDFNSGQNRQPFSAIFLDIDFFKSVNDQFGHTVGDTVLISVARLLQHETYSGELVGRYGGEEFVVLCPDTELEQAVKRAERLRIAMASIRIPELQKFQLTASFGVTQVEFGDVSESILRRADTALYQAKEGGRNQTRSLTNVQLLSEEKADAETSSRTEGFRYQGAFDAFTAADMLVYKLGGFVNDHRAKLCEVAAKRVTFRVGKLGLLPFWGKTDERRPVEVELIISDPVKTTGHGVAAISRVQVTVRIRPLGWIKNVDIFQTRAHTLCKQLCSYFAGERH